MLILPNENEAVFFNYFKLYNNSKILKTKKYTDIMRLSVPQNSPFIN